MVRIAMEEMLGESSKATKSFNCPQPFRANHEMGLAGQWITSKY